MRVFIDRTAVGWQLWALALWMIFTSFFIFSHLFWNFLMDRYYFYSWEKSPKKYLFFLFPQLFSCGKIRLASLILGFMLSECELCHNFVFEVSASSYLFPTPKLLQSSGCAVIRWGFASALNSRAHPSWLEHPDVNLIFP